MTAPLTPPRTALEQSLVDLLEMHNLCHVSIDANRHHDVAGGQPYFAVTLQWLDESKEYGRGISTGMADTISDALRVAVTSMLNRRGSAVELADEALPGVAA